MLAKFIPEDFYKYRQINIDDSVISIQKRRRRLNILRRWAASFENIELTDKHIYKNSYWNFKIPIIDSIANDNDFDTQKECIQYMINALCNIINKGTINITNKNYKVMCLLDLPRLHGSELTIFVNKDYYENFFIRKHPSHNLTPIHQDTNLLEEYKIEIPKNTVLDKKCFKEIINDEDEYYVGKLWAIGQLGSW